MLRRVHQLPNGEQVLVTVDGDEVEVATRSNVWDSWSAPLAETNRADDPSDALPRYPRGERTY